MKIKTSKLKDAVLDWAVAKCEGADYLAAHKDGFAEEYFSYSTNWSQGGPIIEKHPIQVGLDHRDRELFAAHSQNGVSCVQYGPTPLIAAMRCFVVSKLGDEVEVPDELC